MNKKLVEKRVAASTLKLLIIVSIILYLIFPIMSWNKLLVDFEVGFQYAANALNSKGAMIFANESYWNTFFTIHPPLYVYCLAATFKVLGPTAQAARLFGLTCVIITTFLVYAIFKEIFGKDKEVPAALASLFYLSNPLVIQGSLFLDIDNTILTMLLMLFTFFYLKWQEKASLKQLIFLAIIFCLIIWSKVTTSLVIIPAVFLFQIFNGNIKKSFYHSVIISFTGIGLFLISLWIYCYITGSHYFINYVVSPFILAKDKQLYGTLFFKIFTVFKILIRLMLWSSPFLFLLVIIGLVKVLKTIIQNKINKPAIFLIIYAFIILGSYFYIGGSHIFLKYQIPAIPVFAILAAVALPFDFEKLKIKHIASIIAVISIATLYYIYVVGDPILTSNYNLKDSIIRGTVLSAGIVKKIIIQFIFYIFPICFLLVIPLIVKGRFYSKLIYLLLILTFSANLGLNVLQAKSDYNHMDHYGIGEEDTKKVLKFIKENVNPGDEIFAPVDINYFLNRFVFIYTDVDTLTYPEKFMVRLNDNKIKCFVYRISNVSLSQIDNVLNNPGVQEKLNHYFRYYEFGPYFIWLRKKANY